MTERVVVDRGTVSLVVWATSVVAKEDAIVTEPFTEPERELMICVM
jgi:hypothetical protein